MLVQGTLWHHCLRHLESEVPEQQFNTWVRPLQAVEREGELQLLAPNRFVVSWIEKNLFTRIEELLGVRGTSRGARVTLEVGTRRDEIPAADPGKSLVSAGKAPEQKPTGSRLNPGFRSGSFGEG